MAVAFTEWQNRNENRNYPLHDSASKQDVDGDLLPDDFLCDAHIMVPRSAGRYVFVSSAALSPSLVSVTLLATDVDPFDDAPSSSDSGDQVDFVPLATLTLPRPVELYRNYAIEAMYPGVGGWLAFGNGINERSALSLRFDNPAATTLVSRAARWYDDLPVLSMSRLNQLTKLTGLVLLRGEAGLVKVRKALREINGVQREVITIGLDLDAAVDPAAQLHRFTGPCGDRPEEGTCPSQAIATINGVQPDCHGNLRIRVVGLDATIVGIDATGDEGDLVASGHVIDIPISLDDACVTLDLRLAEDLCLSSLSSVSSPSESSPSEEPPESSPSASPDDYCDSFDDESATFAVLIPKGAASRKWDVRDVVHCDYAADTHYTSPRLLSGRGIFTPQVIVHDSLWKSSTAGYTVEGIIRPITERGNGHVIFGYKHIDDFWFAGISLDSIAAASGILYVGRKSAARTTRADNWPNGLDFGYQFTQAGSPDTDFGPPGSTGGTPPSLGPDGLFNTDIRVKVSIEPIAPGSQIRLVQVHFIWDETTMGVPSFEPFASIIFTVSPSDSDLHGYGGLGTVGSETEFDNFGIDCAGGFTVPGQSSGCPL
ncbi:hypothetical protein LCGC14_0603920 [marine sediment metagenome]|uniref:Uncharacterized protein n=1 Tax=marine sediment metagenome TaxID=412755 RepID=A0A0F9RTS9_9ZZZZ